jgi:uncharacterized protein (TIGR02594 family)
MIPLDYAWLELGTAEIPGKPDNPRILEYQKHSPGVPDDDEIAWCSDFVGWCVGQAQITPTKLANARSWLDWGEPVLYGWLPGDVCILWRSSPESWKGHVGFYLGGNPQWVALLGGNQGNRVSVAMYPAKRVLGFRRI